MDDDDRGLGEILGLDSIDEDKVYIVEHGIDYSGEAPDIICYCRTRGRAIKEVKKYIRRVRKNGAGYKLAGKWVKKEHYWVLDDGGRQDEWICISEVEVLS